MARVLLFILGIGFVVWGAAVAGLAFFGTETSAVITSIRREGGQHPGSIPNRYTYNVHYSFTTTSGTVKSGFSKKVGSAFYSNSGGKSSTTIVYYPALPFVNALKSDVDTPYRQLMYIAAGCLLMFFTAWSGKKKKRVKKL